MSDEHTITKEQSLIDVTVSAQKFLSCVKRTDEMYGAGYIADVLRGSQSQKIIENKHHELPTYGIGKEYSKEQWLYFSDLLVKNGLLYREPKHGSLKLFREAWRVIRGEDKFYAKTENILDNTLFELLMEKRKKLAEISNFPTYLIFSDKTLTEMATYFPQSEDKLMQMHGIGSDKYKKYGKIFLDLLCKYCGERQLEEKTKSSTTQNLTLNPKALPKTVKKPKHILISEKYNVGSTLTELIEEFNVKPDTIFDHLYKYSAEGHSIRQSSEFLEYSKLSDEEQINVLKAFEQHGTEKLKPVFEALEEQISYEELRVLRLYYLTKEL